MANQPNYMGDYVVEEEFELEDFDAMDEKIHARQGGDRSLHDYDMPSKETDTTAAQARNGKDVRGILWDGLSLTTKKYREARVEQYKNYENVPSSGNTLDKECQSVPKGGNYFAFYHNTRLVKPTILHFQVCGILLCQV